MFRFLHVYTLCAWLGFGVAFDLAYFGLITPVAEQMSYMALDFAAKVVFSNGIMLSTLRRNEQQRCVATPRGACAACPACS